MYESQGGSSPILHGLGETRDGTMVGGLEPSSVVSIVDGTNIIMYTN